VGRGTQRDARARCGETIEDALVKRQVKRVATEAVTGRPPARSSKEVQAVRLKIAPYDRRRQPWRLPQRDSTQAGGVTLRLAEAGAGAPLSALQLAPSTALPAPPPAAGTSLAWSHTHRTYLINVHIGICRDVLENEVLILIHPVVIQDGCVLQGIASETCKVAARGRILPVHT
jgi:hypothetical protein